jgi:hypothetical protein
VGQGWREKAVTFATIALIVAIVVVVLLALTAQQLLNAS